MALTIIRAGAEEYGAWVKMLLCGQSGSGKTRHPSCWPDPLYLSAEGGLMSVADRQVPAVNVTKVAQINEAVQMLRQSASVRESMIGVPVQTVAVDTIDEVWRLICKERLTEKRQDQMQQADWGYCGDQLRSIVRSLRNLDMNVIFCCHIKETTDEESGRVTVRPQIQGAMGDEIPSYVDLAVLLTARPVTVVQDGQSKKVLKRILQTYPDANHPWIKDRSGQLPMELEINFNDDYERIHNYVYGGAGHQASVVLKEAQAPVEAAPTPAPKKPAVPLKKAPTLPIQKDAPAPVPPVTKPIPPKKPAPPVAVEPVAEAEETKTVDEDGVVTRVATDPTPVTEVEPVEPVVEPETTEPPQPELPEGALGVCESCSVPIDAVEQWDLSFIRFRQHLCRTCFRAKQPVRK